MEYYASRAKKNLINAKNELKNINNLLQEAISINNENFQKEELSNIYQNINNQLNILNYNIIPAIRKNVE